MYYSLEKNLISLFEMKFIVVIEEIKGRLLLVLSTEKTYFPDI